MPKSTTLVRVLGQLQPLQYLPAEALARLADEAQIEEHPPGTVIFRRGEHDPWTRYVLSGEVQLSASEPGHAKRSLVGVGDQGAVGEPLGWHQPPSYAAISHSEVRLIPLPKRSIEQYLAAARPAEPVVETVDPDRESVGVRLFHALFQDLQNGTLALPTVPDIALRVRRAVNEDEVSPAGLARIVQIDPAVATRVVQAANSALYGRGGSRVDTLTAAIQRLGLERTREIVTAVTLREVFSSRHPLLNRRMNGLWRRSTLVAASAAVLARTLPGFLPDRALLAGLIHDIGAVPMVGHAYRYPELADDDSLLEATIDAYSAPVGELILRRWHFPDDLVQIPARTATWERSQDGDGDYADLVSVALHQVDRDPAQPPLSSLPAAIALGLERVGSDRIRSVLDEARGEVADIQGVLLG